MPVSPSTLCCLTCTSGAILSLIGRGYTCRGLVSVQYPMSSVSDDDEEDDLHLLYQPKSVKRAGHHNSSTASSVLNAVSKQRKTVYEMERDERVAKALLQNNISKVDLIGPSKPEETKAEGCVDPESDTMVTAVHYQGNRGFRGGPRGGRGRYGSRGNGYHDANYNSPRQITHRQNMYVMRNALREVDPSTKQDMQVTSAPNDFHSGPGSMQQFRSTNRYVPQGRGSVFQGTSSDENRGRGQRGRWRGGGDELSYKRHRSE